MEPLSQAIRNHKMKQKPSETTAREACRYLSAGYCVDRINSDTPNGTMKVAVVGLLRAAGAEWLWSVVTNPLVQFVGGWVSWLKGKPAPGRTPFKDLPQWWQELPDGNLRGSQNYYK